MDQDDEAVEDRQVEDEEGWWRRWLRNGRLSGVVFGLLLVTSTTLRVAKIDAPDINNLVIVFGGIFAANLTVAKGGEKK